MSMATTSVQPENKTEVAVLKTIVARLREARGLAGIYDYQVVNWLGVSATKITELEEGIHTAPLSTIKKAAEIFDVSIDYLFGEAEDWEKCLEVRKERDFSVHLQGLLIAEQTKIAAEMVKQNGQIAALSEAVIVLAPAIRAVYDAMLRFWELNPGFDEMVAGAPVIHYLDLADKAGHEATCKMVRYGILPFEELNSYSIQEPTNQMVNHV